MVFGVFTGFPLRKNFAMKEQLDWVIMHLQAGGFWLKWNRDMFDEKVQCFGHNIFYIYRFVSRFFYHPLKTISLSHSL